MINYHQAESSLPQNSQKLVFLQLLARLSRAILAVAFLKLVPQSRQIFCKATAAFNERRFLGIHNSRSELSY